MKKNQPIEEGFHRSEQAWKDLEIRAQAAEKQLKVLCAADPALIQRIESLEKAIDDMEMKELLEITIKKASKEARAVPAWKKSADVELELARLRIKK